MDRETLQARNRSTCRFLKEKKLHNLPYLLLIGPTNAGKTTLLKQSELSFSLEKRILSADRIPPTSQYDFWVTKSSIFIDTPGALFSQQNDEHDEERYQFNKFLAKSFYRSNCQGIVFIINIDTLLNLDQTKKLKELTSRIQKLHTEFQAQLKRNLPVSFVFNKMDLINGFSEFFFDLAKTERQQPWGIQPNPEKQLEKTISESYDELLEQLKQQLFWRLEHEVDPSKRSLVNNFPLQMVELKQTILNFFAGLINKDFNDKIHGVFFTSAIQPAALSNNIELDVDEEHALIKTHAIIRPAFFANSLFQHRFYLKEPFNALIKFRTVKWSLKLIAFLLSLFAVVILGLFWTMGYKVEMKEISHAEQAVSAYQILSRNESQQPFENQLQSIYYLKSALSDFDTQSIAVTSPLAPKRTITLIHNQTLKTYQRALREFMLPKVNEILTTFLQDPHAPANVQYTALKAYLLLTDKTRYNSQQIQTLLQKIWSSYYPNSQDNEKVFSYLHDLFGQEPILLAADQNIIKTARQNLYNRGTGHLAYAIFKSTLPPPVELSLNLNNNKSAAKVFTFANPSLSINSFFTAATYEQIKTSEFENSAKIALTGDWVLGQPPLDQQKLSVQQVIEGMKKAYLSDYNNAWLNFLSNIKIINFTSLDDLNTALNALTGDNSLLKQFANLISKNSLADAFNQDPELSGLLKAVNKPANDKTSIDAIIQQLSNLNKTITQITQADNPDQQALNIAVYRMRNNGGNDEIEQLLTLSQVMPEPLKDWIYSIASNSWQLILFRAQNAINQHWKKEIVPQYAAQLSNRYPFSINATDVAPLESFAYFFAPDSGLLDKFLNENIYPFIDHSEIPWKLKNLDGNELNISAVTLKQLEMIKKIQTTYFQNNDRHIYLPFSVTPNSMSDNIQKITLNLGQQSFSFDNNTPYQTTQFIWPDNFNSNSCNITILDTNSQTDTLDCSGSWGLFQLLAKNNLSATHDNPGTYSTTFSDKGYEFTLLFKDHWLFNPFSLELLHNFVLPDSID